MKAKLTHLSLSVLANGNASDIIVAAYRSHDAKALKQYCVQAFQNAQIQPEDNSRINILKIAIYFHGKAYLDRHIFDSYPQVSRENAIEEVLIGSSTKKGLVERLTNAAQKGEVGDVAHYIAHAINFAKRDVVGLLTKTTPHNIAAHSVDSLDAPGQNGEPSLGEMLSSTLLSSSTEEDKVSWKDRILESAERSLKLKSPTTADKKMAILRLRLEGKRPPEIADALSMKVGTVKSSLHYIEKNIRHGLNAEDFGR